MGFFYGEIMPQEGSSTSYCTAAELKPYIDKRVLAALLSDTGTPLTGDPFTDSVNLPSILLAASGTLESACLVGAKYTADELDNLPAASKQHMIRILAGLVMDTLRNRRTEFSTGDKEVRGASWAEKQIVMLRNGHRIFSIASVQDARAGTQTRDESPTARANRRDIVVRNSRYFGVRGF